LGENFCILPSFGTYTGGLNINSDILKKILPKEKTVIAIGKNKLLEI
jgi:metallophosphoesterase superfamily enzyme